MEVAQIWSIFLAEQVLFFKFGLESGLGYTLGDYITNSSGPPVPSGRIQTTLGKGSPCEARPKCALSNLTK
jgi:hypothetical protein